MPVIARQPFWQVVLHLTSGVTVIGLVNYWQEISSLRHHSFISSLHYHFLIARLQSLHCFRHTTCMKL